MSSRKSSSAILTNTTHRTYCDKLHNSSCSSRPVAPSSPDRLRAYSQKQPKNLSVECGNSCKIVRFCGFHPTLREIHIHKAHKAGSVKQHKHSGSYVGSEHNWLPDFRAHSDCTYVVKPMHIPRRQFFCNRRMLPLWIFCPGVAVSQPSLWIM